MTRDEVLQLLGICKRAWPAHYRQMTREEAEGVAALWEAMLCDYEAEIAIAAVKLLIAKDTKGFPPSIGQMIEQIIALKKPEGYPTEAEAWAQVQDAIADGIYHAQKGFEKLHPLVKRVVESPSRINRWAWEEHDGISAEVNVRPMFCRSYVQVVAAEKEAGAVPPSIARQLPQFVTDTLPPPDERAPAPTEAPENAGSAEAGTGQGFARFCEAIAKLAEQMQAENGGGSDDIREHDRAMREWTEQQAARLIAERDARKGEESG